MNPCAGPWKPTSPIMPVKAFTPGVTSSASSAAPSPPAGSTGWWKAYSGVYSDAGTTPATVDGTAVYRMADNVASNHADQVTLGLRPLLKTAQTVSGRNVLRYDGSDDYSIAAFDGTAYTNLSLGLLIRPLDTSGTKGIFQWANALSSGVPFLLVQRNITDVRFYMDNGYQFTVAHDASVFKAYSLTYDNTTWNLKVNGVIQTPYVGGAANKANATSVYFGNGFNGCCNCDVAECLLSNTVLDYSTYLMSIGGL